MSRSDSAHRYSNIVAVACGLLGMIIVFVAAHIVGLRDDAWLAILSVDVGLCGGWVLGANYVYFLFYDESGAAKPHTAKLRDGIYLLRCAFGRHHWVYDPYPPDGVIRPMECEFCRRKINERY